MEKYIGFRDQRSEYKREFDENDELLKAKMATIENALRDHMRNSGVQSMKVDGATVYTEDVVKPAVEDWPAFQEFVLSQGDIGFLQKRISEASYREYIAQHPGVVMPGVTTTTTREVRVRRANSNKEG